MMWKPAKLETKQRKEGGKEAATAYSKSVIPEMKMVWPAWRRTCTSAASTDFVCWISSRHRDSLKV